MNGVMQDGINGIKRQIVSKRGQMTSWNDFMEAADNYWSHVRNWTKSGQIFGDFFWGQPRDPPRPEMLAALQGSLEKGSRPDAPSDYFGYCFFEGEAQAAVAKMILKHRRLKVNPEDCLLTNGALGALKVSLQALTDPGDEVIMTIPWYFFYPGMCELLGIKLIGVSSKPDNHNLDLEAIEQAITTKTRVILVNSPNNPTGVIYDNDTLQALGRLLNRKNKDRDTPIVLISDEAYCRIVFDGTFAPSPVIAYDHSLLIYTFGKSTLAPGERLGYIALSPRLMNRKALRESLKRAITTGWARPSSTTGHALANMDKVLIDIKQLEARRDRLHSGLCKLGYSVTKPQGSFYMMVKCPRGLSGSDFAKELARERVLVVPGNIMGLPRHIRLSLTCSDDMIEFALPVFQQLKDTGVANIFMINGS